MAYLGQHLYNCRMVPFNFHLTELLVLSGAKFKGHTANPCGHAMLRAGSFYFHIDGWNDLPWFMDQVGFKRYLLENDKTVDRRILVVLPNPEAAQRKLNELTTAPWHWRGLWNNCATFVEAILAAGGRPGLTSYGNCPRGGWR
jgi:hypothetical protein